jgi:iron complex outermembrane receptor protein
MAKHLDLITTQLARPASARHILRLALASGATAACLGGAQTARAQDAAGEQAEEIVVTAARQRAENLQKVPLSISALGGSALEAARINTLQGIEYSVPNLVFGETGSSGETFVGLRGIGDFSRNIGFDTRVGVYIDGVFAGQSLAVDQGLVDIAQVEVLRGPQGTLFGKNSSSGVISIVTQAPKLSVTSGKFQGGVGNLGSYNGSAIVNLPLGGSAAARLSFVGQKQDGYVKNLTTGKDLLSNNHLLGRARVRIEPTADLTVDLSGDFRMQDNDILFLEPEPDANAPHRFEVAQDGPLNEQNRGWGLGATAEYSFASGHKLTSITGYRKARRRVGSDEDASPAYGLHVRFFRDEFTHFTQELRIASPDKKRFRYVVGGYFFRQHGAQDRTALFGPAFGAPPDTLAARGTAIVDTRALAGFLNANFDVTDRLTLSGGLRYTSEEKKVTMSQFGSPAGLGDFTNFRDKLNDDSVTASANIQYKVGDLVLLYGGYSRGHKSGGFNVDFVGDPSVVPFDSETVDSFEVGLKSDLFDNRLRLNIAAFHAKYKDFQVFQFQSVGTTTLLIASNAASVTTKGVELEARLRVTPRLEISYGLGYVDAEFSDFPGGASDNNGAPINIAGNVLPRSSLRVPAPATTSKSAEPAGDWLSPTCPEVSSTSTLTIETVTVKLDMGCLMLLWIWTSAKRGRSGSGGRTLPTAPIAPIAV